MDDENEMHFFLVVGVTGLFFGNGTTMKAINSVVKLFNDKKYGAIQ